MINKKIIFLISMLLFLFNTGLLSGESVSSHYYSSKFENSSVNLYEKSESKTYTTYSSGSACCPTGRICEFDTDYGKCICNPIESDPHCMYDGCEEITINGKNKCSCPCKGFSQFINNEMNIPKIEPVPTLKTQTHIAKNKNSDTVSIDKNSQKEKPYAKFNIRISNSSEIILESNISDKREISVKRGSNLKLVLECLKTNIPGFIAIRENGKIIADKYVNPANSNPLSYSYQALKDKEWSFTFCDDDGVVITEETILIQMDKEIPRDSVLNVKNKTQESDIKQIQGTHAVISNTKNSVKN